MNATRRARPEYAIWQGMVQRCTNPRRRCYGSYGGRGITVCDRWRDSFESFLADIGPRPSMAHSLDRIDNAKGYEPGNVRWATRSEQMRNMRSNHWFDLAGRRVLLDEIVAAAGTSTGSVRYWLARGLTPDQVVARAKNGPAGEPGVPNAKLTRARAEQVRTMLAGGVSIAEASALTGMSKTQLRRIAAGTAWSGERAAVPGSGHANPDHPEVLIRPSSAKREERDNA